MVGEATRSIALTVFTAALLSPAAGFAQSSPEPSQAPTRAQTESQAPSSADPFLAALARAKKKRPASRA